MKICVIGSGYVGLITAAGFASLGNDVVCVDRHQDKVDMINSKKPPIFEDGLPELLAKVVPAKLKATMDLAGAVSKSEVIFICVGTPSSPDGSADLTAIIGASKGIGEAFKASKLSNYPIVIVKSTVVPGTTQTVVVPEIEKASGLKAGKDFGASMAPEFLREGKAVEDFLKPDRIVVGTTDERTKKILEPLFAQINCPKLWVNPKTAEMIKYASNSFLATKISFINELGNYCKQIGIDTYQVAEGMGLDKRIGRPFLNSGCGFGGSCFPKDVKALQHIMKRDGFTPILLDSVMDVNDVQPLKMVSLLEKRLGKLNGKNIAVLGLAFKPGTDDVRDSPAFPIIDDLSKKGAKVIGFDPEASQNFEKKVPASASVEYASTGQAAVDKSDGVLLVTDWPQFNFFEYGAKPVIDGKNVLDYKKRATVKNYEGICW